MQQSILFVSNLFPPSVIGGAEIVAYRHAVALAARGNDMVVFAGCFPTADCVPQGVSVDEPDGFPVYRLPVKSFDPNENFYWPEAGHRLRSIITVHRPDIVHFHNLPALGANLILVAKEAGVRTVLTLHDHLGFCYKNTLLRPDGSVCSNFEECATCLSQIRTSGETEIPIRLRRDYILWCLSNVDLLLSPSAYLASAYSKALLGRRPISRLSYGVDLKAVPPVERSVEGCVEFVCFSYLGVHKGIPTLLAAAESLTQRDELKGKWRLTIAGDGPLAGTLARDIASGRFYGAVKYVGRLTNAQALELLRQSHVVILASIWPENEPVTLLEAIASGAAQLVTRIGGSVELVEENLSGLLVAPGSVDELADGMRRYVVEPRCVSEYGAFNLERRHRFDQAKTVESLESIYNSLVKADPVSDFVVICAGGAAPQDARMMLDHFHTIEEVPVRAHFIWHEWANSGIWRSARALWFWRDAGEEDLALIRRAHRAGVPILVPRGGRSLPLAGPTGQTFSYSNFLEALGKIAALTKVPEFSHTLGVRGRDVARLINAISPKSTFNLPLELPL
jgi:glycosyltransferase involved in cell wall biosynthesis